MTARAGRRRPGISVCMPAYNEAANLPGMVDDVMRVMSERFQRVEVVVTDDGSTDQTPAVLGALATRFPLRTVHHERNLGYGAAGRAALAAATEELILFTDADRQFALEDIDRLLAHIDTHALVIGYRAPRCDPPRRVLAGRAWSALANLLCGHLGRDVNCAFKLVWRWAFEAVAPAIAARGATFSAEWLARSRRAGLTVAEIPVRPYARQAGTATGCRPDVIARGVLELVQLRTRLGATVAVSRPAAMPSNPSGVRRGP